MCPFPAQFRRSSPSSSWCMINPILPVWASPGVLGLCGALSAGRLRVRSGGPGVHGLEQRAVPRSSRAGSSSRGPGSILQERPERTRSSPERADKPGAAEREQHGAAT
ncbi:hypothetical protein GDO81_025410, partial [Engystomops pustulosus]